MTQKRVADIFKTSKDSIHLGQLHFVGIGGIGMSGIAQILLHMGCQISGSDMKQSDTVKRLQDLGATIHIGHYADNVVGADAVVVSTAIKSDNVEYTSALEHRIPIVHRSEMLAEIMRLKMSIAIAGTHGKTTTTSLTAHALITGGMEPTVVNGGILNNLGSNATLGQGAWLVAEADESDGSFTRLPIGIAVVTNMDPEHLDYYKSYDNIKKAFMQFVNNTPFYGCIILCEDHLEVRKMRMHIHNRRIVTYGLNPQANVRAVNIQDTPTGHIFDVITPYGTAHGVEIPISGTHNIQNTLASIAVALETGIDVQALPKLFVDFQGVKRRFSSAGTLNGARVIDDYAHHPVEIQAVLQAGRSVVSRTHGKVYAVVQPHRYSRLHSLFTDFSTCFTDADCVITVPVFPAGEPPITGATHTELSKHIIASGHGNCLCADDFDMAYDMLKSRVSSDDIVIYMGAGDITTYAYQAGQKG